MGPPQHTATASAHDHLQPLPNQPTSLEFIEDPYLPAAAATPSLDDLNAAFDDRLLFDDATVADDDDDGLHESHANASLEWSPETELYLRQMPLEQIFCISDDRDDCDDGDAELGAIDHRNKMIGGVGGDGRRVAATAAAAASRSDGTGASSATSNPRTQAFLQRLFGGKSMADVRVSFSDLSKSLLKRRSGVGMCACSCVHVRMCVGLLLRSRI